jgi:Co/Zn/Cd efflux system component
VGSRGMSARIGAELESTAIKADAWHHLSDALTSGFAFIGISVALIGGKGWEAADDWAALAASCVILFNAWHQMKPAVLELSDASPDPTFERKALALACSLPGVFGTEKCFVRKSRVQLLYRPACCRRRKDDGSGGTRDCSCSQESTPPHEELLHPTTQALHLAVVRLAVIAMHGRSISSITRALCLQVGLSSGQ